MILSKNRILSAETESDTPGSLQPERSKGNVLHDRVDITMPTLDGTVNIEGGCACRFIHASHHARRRLRGHGGHSPIRDHVARPSPVFLECMSSIRRSAPDGAVVAPMPSSLLMKRPSLELMVALASPEMDRPGLSSQPTQAGCRSQPVRSPDTTRRSLRTRWQRTAFDKADDRPEGNQ